MKIISADELYAFYAELGQALYAVQTVEATLHKILCIRVEFAEARPTQSEADEILEKYRSKTLGQLIRICQSKNVLNSSLLQSLDALNSKRNFIVHRLQDFTEVNLRIDAGFRERLATELSSVAEEAFKLGAILVKDVFESLPRVLENPIFKQAFDNQLRARGFNPD
jgi:hypothetical protein